MSRYVHRFQQFSLNIKIQGKKAEMGKIDRMDQDVWDGY